MAGNLQGLLCDVLGLGSKQQAAVASPGDDLHSTAAEPVAAGGDAPQFATAAAHAAAVQPQARDTVAGGTSDGAGAVQPADAGPYAARLLQVEHRFASEAAAARRARAALQAAQADARQRELDVLAAADAAFTPGWRRAGLPAKASQLALDAAWLSSSHLLDAGALAARQAAWQHAEVLQPPSVQPYSNKAAAPHYLASTGNQKVRERIAASKVATNSSCSSSSSSRSKRGGSSYVPWSQLPAADVAAKVASAAARHRALAAVTTPEQRANEERVIKRMYQRLSFLRNPRHMPAPPAVPGSECSLRGLAKAHQPRHSQRVRSPARAIAADASGAAASSRPQLGLLQAAACVPSPADAGFAVVPQSGVRFERYEAGGAYFATVQLQNVGCVAQQLRLLPPASCYFQVSLPRFPLDSSLLAPGLAADVAVCFTPDSRADYTDSLVVDSPGGRFEVPLLGRRRHPKLTLPAVLQVGDVLVGNARRRTFDFVNTGGQGRFLLLPAAAWAAALQQQGQQHDGAHGPPQRSSTSGSPPPPPAAAAAVGEAAGQQDDSSGGALGVSWAAPQQQLIAGPFSISPTHLDLPAGGAGCLVVDFAPTEPGHTHADLVLLCDHCTAHTLRVEGCGGQVALQLAALDGRPWSTQDAEGASAEPVWFGQVCPGACASRQLTLHNPTALPFPFRWCAHDPADASPTSTPRHQQPQQQTAFSVSPPTGVLQPGQTAHFAVTFTPPCVAGHAAVLVLQVQRCGDAGLCSIRELAGAGGSSDGGSMLGSSTAKGRLRPTLGHQSVHALAAGHTGTSLHATATAAAAGQRGVSQAAHPAASSWARVLAVGVEGVGVPLQLQVDPSSHITLPGSLCVGQVLQREVRLVNPTAAPAHVSLVPTAAAAAAGSCGGAACAAAVAISPPQVTVPAYSSLPLQVTFSGIAAGHHSLRFAARVQHGLELQLQATVEVQQARVVPSMAALDLGVLRVGSSMRSRGALMLRNAAASSSTRWRLQLAAEAAALCGPPPVTLLCQPSAGQLDASGCCAVDVTVSGGSEGQHRLLLCVASNSGVCSTCGEQAPADGAGTQLWAQAAPAGALGCSCHREYMELLVTVAAPRLVLDSCRLQLPHAFVGMRQSHRVCVTNTSSVPLTFSWSMRQLSGAQQQRLQQLAHASDAATAPAAAAPAPAATPAAAAPAAPAAAAGVSLDSGGRLGVAVSPPSGSLAPGQQQHVVLQLQPLAPGPVAVLCCCEVPGMRQLAGLLLTAHVRGLQARFEVLTVGKLMLEQQQQQQQQQHAGQRAAAGCVVQDSCLACSSSASAAAPLLADFGAVQLHEPAELFLRITNATSIPSSVRVAVERLAACHGGAAAAIACVAAPAGSTTADSRAARANGTAAPSPTRLQHSPASRQRRVGLPHPAPGIAARLAAATRTLHCLEDDSSSSSSGRALSGPFWAAAGNAMLAARRAAAASAAALGSSAAGCAVQVAPCSCELPAWGSALLRLLAHNNVPGTYTDALVVQVGELPPRRIPLLLRVQGSPLCLSKHRAQRQGAEVLQQLLHPDLPTGTGDDTNTSAATNSSSSSSSSRTQCCLDFGVVPAGMQLQRTLFVSNTGALPVELAWACAAAAPLGKAASSSTPGCGAAAAPAALLPPAAPAAGPGGSSAGGDVPAPDITLLPVSAAVTPSASRPGSAADGGAAPTTRPGSAAGPLRPAAAAAAKAHASASAPGGSSTAKHTAAAKARAASAGGRAGVAAGAVDSNVAAAAAAHVADVSAAAHAPARDAPCAEQPAAAADAAPASIDAGVRSRSSSSRQDASDALPPPGGPSSLLHLLRIKAGTAREAAAADSASKVPAAADDAAAAFAVSPAVCVIPPGGQQQLVVTFSSAQQGGGRQQHTLLGQHKLLLPAASGGSSGGGSCLRLSLLPCAQQGGQQLRCCVSGGYHAHAGPPPTPLPPLCLQLSGTTAAPQLTPTGVDAFVFVCSSTHDPDSHSSFRHTATLLNATGCPQAVALQAPEGPFEVAGVQPSCSQDPAVLRGLLGADSSSAVSGASAGAPQRSSTSSSGAWCTGGALLLPLGESVDVTLAFRPPGCWPPHTAAASAASDAEEGGSGSLAGQPEAGAAWSYTGVLPIQFGNGHQQRLQLSATVLQPALAVAPAGGVLAFGGVHPAAPKTQALTLSNPTLVPAAWSAEVVVCEQQPQGVFRVSPAAGVLPGRGLGTPHSSRLAVTMAPRCTGEAAAVLRLAVAGAPPQAVRLHGTSTHVEAAEAGRLLADAA